jgi:hypothetical protein
VYFLANIQHAIVNVLTAWYYIYGLTKSAQKLGKFRLKQIKLLSLVVKRNGNSKII